METSPGHILNQHVSQCVCGCVQGDRKKWKRTEFSGRWIRGVSAGGPLISFTSSTYRTLLLRFLPLAQQHANVYCNYIGRFMGCDRLMHLCSICLVYEYVSISTHERLKTTFFFLFKSSDTRQCANFRRFALFQATNS